MEFHNKLQDTYQNSNDKNKFNKPGDIEILEVYFNAFREFCADNNIPPIRYEYNDFKNKELIIV